MSWKLIRQARARLARETGATLKSREHKLSLAMCYPNTYHVGMSNLGLHAIYNLWNDFGQGVCERAFLPDPGDLAEFERTRTPLFSVESQTPLREFDLVGFSLQYEEDYLNVLRMLDLAGIPVRSSEREECHPIVLAGGPCATFNPEPMADFIDAFVIGDGEPPLEQIYGRMRSCSSVNGGLIRPGREEMLRSLSELPGVYVPGFGERCDLKVSQVQRDVNDHPAHTRIFTRDTEFGGTFLLEVMRGCPRRCRFCMVTYVYRPLRHLTAARALEVARRHRSTTSRVGLVGASVSDHPEAAQLALGLVNDGFSVSMSSMRADTLSDELLEALARSGQRSITVAPESGSERLRSVIAKPVTDEQFVDCTRRAVLHGIKHIKFYILLGYPTETEAEVEQIGPFCRKILGAGAERITLSVNPLIPKPLTPLQYAGMARPEELTRRARVLRDSVQGERRIETEVISVRWSVIQALLARGDRSVGRTLHAAYRNGGRYRDWLAAIESTGCDLDWFVHRERSPQETMPWDFVDVGTRPRRLQVEWARTQAGGPAFGKWPGERLDTVTR